MTVLAPLAAMDVPGRLPRVRAAMEEAGCDTLLVTKLVNIRWLTGFSGSAALALITLDELLFVSDSRYRDQAAEQLAAAGVEARIEIPPTVAGQRDVIAATASGPRRIGLEAHAVTWAEQRTYATEWFPDADLMATAGLIERLRVVKDDGEVARIEAAAGIADEALAEIRPMLSDGPSEQDVAAELDHRIRRLGAEGNSFPTIVGSGPNGAKPHHEPGPRVIRPGDLVVMDFGALVDGYCSDMTRTVCVGDPTPTQARMLEVVLAAQAAGVAAVRAGVPTREVDRACRDVITEAGWKEAFGHPAGHGVGLEIHEAPRVSWVTDDVLEAGHVVTVEPGVYLPEHGGVRIEDTVLVTADGRRALTHTPKTTTVAGAR